MRTTIFAARAARPLTAIALLATGFVGLVPACTFGGLANYAIEQCTPKAKQSDDVCNRLNKDPATCTPYQCDPASHRCIERPRDDDRDGDTPVRCGGTDCDDTDSARSGKAKEVCDRRDNNCNDLADEDALPVGASIVIATPRDLSVTADGIIVPSGDGQSLLGAFVDGKDGCIPIVKLTETPAAVTGCSVLNDEKTLVPHQPYPLVVGLNYGAAFVRTSGCATGTLSYRTSVGKGFDLSCDAARNVALPAMAAMPNSANENSGVVAWFGAKYADRSDPIGGCAALQPAPLELLYVKDLRDPVKSPLWTEVRAVSEGSLATRPPSMLAVDSIGALLLAAPLGSDVGVWVLTKESLEQGVLPAPTRVAGLANARATALTMRTTDSGIQLALVAEIGCRPQVSIKLAFGRIDTAAKIVTFDAPIDVQSPIAVATSPSIAWVSDPRNPSREEWWVGWLDAQAHGFVRRFTPDGKPIGGAIDIGRPFKLGAVSESSEGTVFGLDPAASNGSFVAVPLRCAQ